MSPSSSSHSDPKRDPKRSRAIAPKSAQPLGFHAHAYFDFINQNQSRPAKHPFTEYYSLEWDEKNQKWSLWAELELWEPATEIARSHGNRHQEPDVFELLKTVWKERAESAHFRLDRFEQSE
ncbi:MAG: hypothetical protein AAGH89_17190, partial [Verrucomicrobiota bacterium]